MARCRRRAAGYTRNDGLDDAVRATTAGLRAAGAVIVGLYMLGSYVVSLLGQLAVTMRDAARLITSSVVLGLCSFHEAWYLETNGVYNRLASSPERGAPSCWLTCYYLDCLQHLPVELLLM